MRLLALLFTLCFPFAAFSQPESPRFSFLQDSFFVAQPIKAFLVFSHPKEKEVFFPKGEELFEPFKVMSMEVFPTKTQNGHSIDSVIYTFQCFEVKDDKKSLKLPVWVWEGDSVATFSNTDTIYYVSSIKDTSAFILDRKILITSQEKYFLIRNLPLLATLSLITILGILFLRRPIEKRYISWLYNRKQREFSSQFKKIMKTGRNLDLALDIWKKHMQWLEEKPFTTMSTSEIMSQFSDIRLGEALKEIDANIYGGQDSEQIFLALQILFQKASFLFKVKKKATLKTY